MSDKIYTFRSLFMAAPNYYKTRFGFHTMRQAQDCLRFAGTLDSYEITQINMEDFFSSLEPPRNPKLWECKKPHGNYIIHQQNLDEDLFELSNRSPRYNYYLCVDNEWLRLAQSDDGKVCTRVFAEGEGKDARMSKIIIYADQPPLTGEWKLKKDV